MQQWGWILGEEDEIKIKKMMVLLNCDDYEKVKEIYCKNVVRN
jgi:hypothetical protein